MSGYLEHEISGKVETSANMIAALFLGIGVLIGWGIGSDRAWNAAGEWAIRTTEYCEASYRTESFSSVTDCLKDAIDNGKEEQRAEMQAEGHDPRR